MIRVLIVDDQRLFAGSLKVVLEGHGKGEITVAGIAYNGRQAIEMVRTTNPDVILMDVRMPEMDGVEATKRIAVGHPNIKIMILTTFDDDEYAYQALNNGAYGYMLKNIEPEELVTTIKAVYNGNLVMTQSLGARLFHPPRVDGTKEDRGGDSREIRFLMERFPSLGRREAEVLLLITENLDNHEIAERLFIAGQTVKNYTSPIYQKLGVSDRLHAIKLVASLRNENE